MSYIYEALKRAEDENARGVAAARAVARPAFFTSRPRWWLWALIGVLGANAAGLVTMILVRGSRSPVATTAPTMSAEPAVAPVTAPPRDAAAKRVPLAPADPPAAPAVAAAPPSDAPPPRAVAPTPRVNRAAPPAPRPVPPAARSAPPSAAPATPAPAPAARSEPAAPRIAEPPATTAVPRTATRDGAEARPAPPPTAPASPSVAAVAPTAGASSSESPAPAAVDAPKLQIQVVVYSDVPAQRLVFIDGRRYAEGEKVDAETVIERITPQGAVVTRRGQRFTLTSGRP